MRERVTLSYAYIPFKIITLIIFSLLNVFNNNSGTSDPLVKVNSTKSLTALRLLHRLVLLIVCFIYPMSGRVQTGTGKVDPARKLKCTTAACELLSSKIYWEEQNCFKLLMIISCSYNCFLNFWYVTGYISCSYNCLNFWFVTGYISCSYNCFKLLICNRIHLLFL